ncbi:MAG: hypothetical protein DMG74_17650 [Acidobacteria bacterium]|nr:MAG: hypothetical protein DMG74_17650 [Acidobacteriota bacterium]
MSSLPPPQVAEQSALRDLPVTFHAKPVYQVCKRMLDVVVSGVFLVLLTPVWLVLAILIKLDSTGPVFFVHPAVGRSGSEFVLYKFRSMLPASHIPDHIAHVESNLRRGESTCSDRMGPIFKTALTDQSRITRIGRFLRCTSLDELPQVWNVFRGDMSLVGPRPALPYEARLYDEWQKQRFMVKPGMTGWYQVTARNRVPIQEMIRLDLEYVRNQSMALDLKILLRTPVAMFSGM